jgi:CRP-like cAMP-binding protein
MRDFLRRVPLFTDASDELVDRIAGLLRPVSVPGGETVCREGEPGTTFHLIEFGTLLVEAEVGGQRRELARMGSGDFFGEIALLDGGPRSATVTALTDLRLLGLTEWVFRGLLQEHPSIAVKTLESMAGRLRTATKAATA